MKRREFLVAGAAVAAIPAFTRGAGAISKLAGTDGDPSPLAGADVIWSREILPVPLLKGGGNDALASPSERDAPEPDLHTVFAKEITLDAVPAHAVLHLFAFTRYRLYVNGTYVGRGPCRYQNQRPAYDSRDVRQFLHAGKNTLVVLAHRDAPTGRIMRHTPGLVAVLQLEHGGRSQSIATDATWLARPEKSFGPRAQAWASIEEHIDARLGSDWTRPNLQDAAWKPAQVVSSRGSVVFYPRDGALQSEVKRDLQMPALPFALTVGTPVLLHVEQIVQAFHLLQLDAAAGSELEVRYCLPDGEKSGASTYIARDGAQTYMGGDTFALRHVELRLKSGQMRVTQAEVYEVRYPFERVAAFACSDAYLTQLWGICARSLEVLSEDSYVDCADRERVEWTDDSPPAFDCTRVMMRGPDADGKTYWGDARLLRGLLRRIALTQQPDGQIKAHSCSERFDIHAMMEDRSCDWVVLLREYLDATGDAEPVRQLWPTLLRLLAWYRSRRTPRGLTLAREWEVWDNPLRYEICKGAGLNAMVYKALADAAAIAAKTGMRRDAESLSAEAATLKADFNAVLWNEQEGAYYGALFGPGSEVRPQMGHPFEGKVVDGRFQPTVQANLFAVYAGLVPQERLARVQQWVMANSGQITELMSCYYYFRMLYAMQSDAKDREVLRVLRTDWKNQVDSVWQTSWEEMEEGGGSKVHVYGVHPGYFLTAYVLGARRDGPARERKVLVEPRFSGLDWARGVCVTEFGPVPLEWKMDSEGRAEMDCTVPVGVRATLRVRARLNSLNVDGRPVPAAGQTDGYFEAPLAPGKHAIVFDALR